jgi:heme-degrading monooxygenase HmoA
MHATVVRVSIEEAEVESSEEALRDQVVPRISQLPGFRTGYWTRRGNTGVSMVVFDSEEAAQAAADQVRSVAPQGVTIEEVEVREVVAHA